jgi:bacteriorhodopsin
MYMSSYNSGSNTKIPAPVFTNTVPLVPRPPDNISATANTINPTTAKEKIENKLHPVQYYVKASFMVTYILLLTTATITFIEAMRTRVPEVRHVLNLETCISIVAGYFYSLFITQIEGYSKDDKPIDWTDITKTRYIDWTITTPLMLLTLCIVLGHHIGKKVNFFTLLIIVLLNYIMLYIGYLGEVKILGSLFASFLGFIPFTAMFYLVFKNYVQPKYNFANYVLYGVYLCVWSLYGIVYLFKEDYKNIFMNILDCIAKCLIGLGLWAHYSHTIVL